IYRIDLPRAHPRDVEAAIDALDDVPGLAVARRDHRVGHADDGAIAVGFAAAVGGSRDAVSFGVDAVIHVVLEHAFFDQDIAPGGGAFVVEGERAALAREAGVVPDRDQRVAHHFAQLILINGETFPGQIGLQTVSHGFVN